MSSDTRRAQAPTGMVTLDTYLGRTPATGTGDKSRLWPRSDQLLSRFEWYRHMREEHPVARDPETGVWGIFRYADVRRALSDVASFSSALPLAEDNPVAGSMLRVDPPRHRQLRNLVDHAFTVRRVIALRSRVEELSAALIDAALAQGHVDVVRSIGRVLPTQVIGSLLGIDLDRTGDFQRWTAAFMQSLARPATPAESLTLAEMQKYFSDMIAERRHRPGPDLISSAVQAEAGGAHLSDRDILQFCKLLLLAGSETTTHLIVNTVLCLQQDPTLAARARVDPAVLPKVVEEVLRFAAPVQGVQRVAGTEVRLLDQVIPAGAIVYAWVGSAHRDPAEFAEPDTFSIDRTEGRQLAFGHGIHFCVGAVLARLEAEVIVDMMLARLPAVWRVPDTVTVFRSHEMCGLDSLPMTWD